MDQNLHCKANDALRCNNHKDFSIREGEEYNEISQESQGSYKRSFFNAVKIAGLFLLMMSNVMTTEARELTDSDKERDFADTAMCLSLRPEEYHENFRQVINILSSLPKEYVEKQITLFKDFSQKENERLPDNYVALDSDDPAISIDRESLRRMMKFTKLIYMNFPENSHQHDPEIKEAVNSEQKQDLVEASDPENKIFLGELLTLAALGMFTIVFCLGALGGCPIEQYEPRRDWQGSGI